MNSSSAGTYIYLSGVHFDYLPGVILELSTLFTERLGTGYYEHANELLVSSRLFPNNLSCCQLLQELYSVELI
jgi:hypothetical protein